ncbi:glideosome-associated protein with multiple-membrane spans GAPm2b [Cyclospora cayetanensis]|uniref:Glideosome-associated protein with multiple-membrane spans GAPm2b n=1 Tax=Cyclospora cayetanensis TaxID=88456 RepID=A0A1D3D9R5_9EIME|nr:glideosome-associated protein with multiple-membrane spans GAPm2b [Cyclospora cayetanensis]
MEPFGIDSGDVPPLSQQSSLRTLADRFASRASQPLTASFSQQMSFPEGAPEDIGKQLTRQLTQMMNSGAANAYTDESPRGEEHSPLVYYLGARLLRSGLLTQVTALSLQILFFLLFGGNGWFNANIFAAPDALKGASVYVHLSAFLEVAFLLGVIQVAAFQVLVADSSKWTVGFRSGSKILACAVSLDVASAALRVASSLHFCRFVSARWLGRNMQLRGEWTLSYLGGTLQGLSLFSYGLGFAALELYHDKGTKDEYAWGMLFLYPLAAIAKLSSIYLSVTSLSPLLQLAALVLAYVWADTFEPQLERWSPELHTRRLDENILPNPREGAPGGPITEGETYTYTAVPTMTENAASGAPMGAHSRDITSRTRPFETLNTLTSSGSVLDGLPTTYDYDVLQQQVRSHMEQQQQQQ